jgi:hypothetical protein
MWELTNEIQMMDDETALLVYENLEYGQISIPAPIIGNFINNGVEVNADQHTEIDEALLNKLSTLPIKEIQDLQSTYNTDNYYSMFRYEDKYTLILSDLVLENGNRIVPEVTSDSDFEIIYTEMSDKGDAHIYVYLLYPKKLRFQVSISPRRSTPFSIPKIYITVRITSHNKSFDNLRDAQLDDDVLEELNNDLVTKARTWDPVHEIYPIVFELLNIEYDSLESMLNNTNSNMDDDIVPQYNIRDDAG